MSMGKVREGVGGGGGKRWGDFVFVRWDFDILDFLYKLSLE